MLWSRQLSGNALVFVMGSTHTVCYLVAAIVLLVMLGMEGFAVWPNRVSVYYILGSIAYAVVGIYIEQLVNVQGRLACVAYVTVYLLVTAITAYLVLPRVWKTELRSAVKQRRFPQKVKAGV